MSFSVVIPARYASTRLPGKPLVDIAGKPMIQRVYEQACLSQASEVVIATDDERIAEAGRSFGAEVVMTSAEHPSGTDRLQEVATLKAWDDDHIVVNVQGDEPLIPPALIDQVADNLAEQSFAMIATLCEMIKDPETIFNPNAVKVVFDKTGRALYFSRAPIPWMRGEFQDGVPASMPDCRYYRHIGIYGYRIALLHDYVSWPPGMLENTESLEQLRALEQGVGIHVALACEQSPMGVDTAEDLEAIRQLLEDSVEQV